MDKETIYLKIKYLHQKIDQECEEKLKLLDDCFKMKKECETCETRDQCELNFEGLEELNELYEKSELLHSNGKKFDS